MNLIELKCARIRRGKTSQEMSQVIGKRSNAYTQRERGEAQVTLKEAGLIGRALGLSEDEFITVFFDGVAPYLKEPQDCKGST